MNTAIKRRVKDVRDLEKCPLDNIFVECTDDDLMTSREMFIGMDGTPYKYGFFFFLSKYPNDYPINPPNVKYMTQGSDNSASSYPVAIRFNPNTYTCGKVCLSILGTWDGPSWVPTYSQSTVLNSIHALVFNEYPLRNEPGFEKSAIAVLDKYNEIIRHSTFKIALLEMLESPPNGFSCFKDTMNRIFYQNYQDICNDLKTLSKNDGKNITCTYSMTIKLRYGELLTKTKTYYDKNIVPKVEAIKLDIANSEEESLKIKQKFIEDNTQKDAVKNDSKNVAEEVSTEVATEVKNVVAEEESKEKSKEEEKETIVAVIKKMGRKAPSEKANQYSEGHKMVSDNDNQQYIVKKRINGVLYWAKC